MIDQIESSLTKLTKLDGEMLTCVKQQTDSIRSFGMCCSNKNRLLKREHKPYWISWNVLFSFRFHFEPSLFFFFLIDIFWWADLVKVGAEKNLKVSIFWYIWTSTSSVACVWTYSSSRTTLSWSWRHVRWCTLTNAAFPFGFFFFLSLTFCVAYDNLSNT